MTDDSENDATEPTESQADETNETGEESERAELVGTIAGHDEELAAAVEERLADLESRVEEREAELDEQRDRLKRTQADFQNYKKRAKKRQEQVQDRATEDLVERLLGVRDNLKRAVDDDHDDLESLREGVEITLREFDRVLADESVEEIAPEAGHEVDPQRHEVLMRVDSEQEEGTVADVYQPGYEMGDKVLRAAQVTVSDGPANDDEP